MAKYFLNMICLIDFNSSSNITMDIAVRKSESFLGFKTNIFKFVWRIPNSVYDIPHKTPQSHRLSGVFRGYKTGTYAKNDITLKNLNSLQGLDLAQVIYEKTNLNITIAMAMMQNI